MPHTLLGIRIYGYIPVYNALCGCRTVRGGPGDVWGRLGMVIDKHRRCARSLEPGNDVCEGLLQFQRSGHYKSMVRHKPESFVSTIIVCLLKI